MIADNFIKKTIVFRRAEKLEVILFLVIKVRVIGYTLEMLVDRIDYRSLKDFHPC